jgi:hypothetical protein
VLAGACALFALGAAPGADAQTCVADCDQDGTVAVNEIITGVNILLGSADVAQCPSADCNGDAVVTVACLVQAVNGALGGCSAAPTPRVEGPVGGGLGTPFFAGTSFDLGEVGYAQSEYFLSGTARSFRSVGTLGDDGRWAVTPADSAPYRTRVVVHRPVDPSRFNGTVFVEWMNVSGGLDAAPDWTGAHTEMVREGAAWMGLSVQKVGIEGGTALAGVVSLPLKTVDPARYASLAHPGDSFSYDIFSQAAQAIRDRAGIGPLDELPVERIIGLGESQSAFRLVNYINALHRSARMYDGYLVHSRGGFPLPLSEAPQEVITVPGSAAIRDDLDVPTLIFQTESDLTFLNYFPARQPDSATVRLWEVAGTAHADTYLLAVGPSDRGDSIDAARLLVTAEPIAGILRCDQPINSGPQHFVLNAALAALDRWVRDGTPPPVAPRLAVDAGPPITIVRDARGIALGGIRTPAVDAPIAILSGDPQAGSLLCSLFGTTAPFPPATLVELYGDQAGYVAAVEAATAAAVEAGFILPADAELILGAAAATPIGE